MKESDLKSFLEGDVDASWLGRVLEKWDAVPALDADLQAPVTLTPDELLRLCDAHLAGGLSADQLQVVAGLILESDNFAWDEDSAQGELVAEVLWDWAMPEDEIPPTSEAVSLCRRRLASS